MKCKERKKESHVCQLRPGWTVEQKLSLPEGTAPLLGPLKVTANSSAACR